MDRQRIENDQQPPSHGGHTKRSGKVTNPKFPEPTKDADHQPSPAIQPQHQSAAAAPGQRPRRARRVQTEPLHNSPSRERHRVRNLLLGAVGVVVLIIIIASVASGGGNGNKIAGNGSSPASAPSTPSADQQLITELEATTGSDGNSLYSDLQAVGDNPVTMANQMCSGSSSVSVPSGWSSSDEQAFISAVQSTECPGVSMKPAGPQYTAAEQQAIDAAEGYINMGSGFSRQGLIQQLDSSAGDGFSQTLATFAVNHIKVNWYQQAVESAKGYMQMGGFSYSSLVQQLDSSAGEGFTYAQAVYAAKKVGL
jgi:Host cell surface-exposed lipoprotein